MEYAVLVESKLNNSEKDKYYVIFYVEYTEKDKVKLIESENRMVVTSA